MSQSESLTDVSAGGALFSKADLRLVLESIDEAAAIPGSGVASSGLMRLGRDDARKVLLSLFSSETADGAFISVYASETALDVSLTMAFDLDDIASDLRRDIASGISRNRRLIDFLGGIPVDVRSRIDAARSSPRLATHFVATAADHLAWSLRLRIQDMLIPISDHGRRLSWRGRIPVANARDFAGADLLSFATSVDMEVPAHLLENANAQ